MCKPIIKSEHLWVCTKFTSLHIPIYLRQFQIFCQGLKTKTSLIYQFTADRIQNLKKKLLSRMFRSVAPRWLPDCCVLIRQPGENFIRKKIKRTRQLSSPLPQRRRQRRRRRLAERQQQVGENGILATSVGTSHVVLPYSSTVMYIFTFFLCNFSVRTLQCFQIFFFFCPQKVEKTSLKSCS